MNDFVIVAGKANGLFFDGTDAFTKDIERAKSYASEPAAKRAIKKVETASGRTGLRAISKTELTKPKKAAAAAKPKKKAA